MRYRVDITDPALADAEEYFHFIRDTNKEPDAADKWFSGLILAIDSLEIFPARCSIIPEHRDFSLEIRHLIYHSHRIIFGIDSVGGCVTVYRVYPAARRGLSKRDLW